MLNSRTATILIDINDMPSVVVIYTNHITLITYYLSNDTNKTYLNSKLEKFS